MIPLPAREGGYQVVLHWNEVALNKVYSILEEEYHAAAEEFKESLTRAASQNPIAVVDYLDDKELGKFIEVMREQGIVSGIVSFAAVHNALRAWATPPHSNPPEPAGIGALAKDTDDRIWIVADKENVLRRWYSPDVREWRKYTDIKVKSVIREQGVTDA